MSKVKNECSLKGAAYDAVIFDLDGVITQSAKIHANAWKTMFDEYLSDQAKKPGKEYTPFDIQTDYKDFVDGKPRYEGVESFLNSRGIQLPYGSPEDPPDRDTICGLGNRKNELFQKLLQEDGIKVYQTSVDFIDRIREEGFKTALVSSSKNCRRIINMVGMEEMFDSVVDGIRSGKENLKGKPEPDIFLKAAEDLQVKPERAVVIEDAAAGVEAGSKGGFGYILGIDRSGKEATLKEHGATCVVHDLEDFTLE